MSGREFFNLAALEADIVRQLDQALAGRERTSLLVSGGSSPAALYRRLALRELPWDRIDVALVDERWVAAEHPRSNARFIHQTLLQHCAAKAHFTGMYTGDKTPEDGLEQVEGAYRTLPQPFDVTILGMGPDGLFASLFPHAGASSSTCPRSEQLCASICARPSDVTGEEARRMTLSLVGILNSRAIYLVISDKAKLACYHEAAVPGGDVQAMPLRALLHQDRAPINIYYRTMSGESPQGS